MFRCILAALVLTGAVFTMDNTAQAADKALAHDVYFQLTDNSDAARAKLVAACKKYLANHPGIIWISVGTRAKEFTRGVNDQEYDVYISIVFKDKAAHDKYQDHADHHKFIDENKANWKKVRVFDSYLEVSQGGPK